MHGGLGQAGVGAAQRLRARRGAPAEARTCTRTARCRPAVCAAGRSSPASRSVVHHRAFSAWRRCRAGPGAAGGRGRRRSGDRASRSPPTISRAQGSSSSLCGLKRWPRSGRQGPCARKPYTRPGGRRAAEAVPDIAALSRQTPAWRRFGGSAVVASNRHSSMRWRGAENTAKLTPCRPSARPAARAGRAAAPAVWPGSGGPFEEHGGQRRQADDDRLRPAVAAPPASAGQRPGRADVAAAVVGESVFSRSARCRRGHAQAQPWCTTGREVADHQHGPAPSAPCARRPARCGGVVVVDPLEAGGREVQLVQGGLVLYRWFRSRTRRCTPACAGRCSRCQSRLCRGSTRAPARTRSP
jgi:hypothetical protein